VRFFRRGLGIDQANPPAHPVDMGINRQDRFVKSQQKRRRLLLQFGLSEDGPFCCVFATWSAICTTPLPEILSGLSFFGVAKRTSLDQQLPCPACVSRFPR